MPTFNPPLLGDGHGIYRIHLVGNSGMSILPEFSMFQWPRRGAFRDGQGESYKGLAELPLDHEGIHPIVHSRRLPFREIEYSSHSPRWDRLETWMGKNAGGRIQRKDWHLDGAKSSGLDY